MKMNFGIVSQMWTVFVENDWIAEVAIVGIAAVEIMSQTLTQRAIDATDKAMRFANDLARPVFDEFGNALKKAELMMSNIASSQGGRISSTRIKRKVLEIVTPLAEIGDKIGMSEKTERMEEMSSILNRYMKKSDAVTTTQAFLGMVVILHWVAHH